MRGLTSLAVVVLVAVVAACGEDEQPASTTDPDQPVQAPSDPSPPGGAVETPAPPRRCKRVSRRLVDQSLTDARTIADEAGCPLRVVIEDGRSLPVTEDYNLSRINVRVDGGRVTEVLGLY